jgi:hypothetical protein
MYLLLQLIALTMLLLLAQEAIRRANRWAVWGVFLVLPLILTPYWIRVNELVVQVLHGLLLRLLGHGAALHIARESSLGSVYHPSVTRGKYL